MGITCEPHRGRDLIEPGKEGDGGDGGGPECRRIGLVSVPRLNEPGLGRTCGRFGADEGINRMIFEQARPAAGRPSLPQRHKALLAGDLEAHGKNARYVNAHGLNGVPDQRASEENARHRGRETASSTARTSRCRPWHSVS